MTTVDKVFMGKILTATKGQNSSVGTDTERARVLTRGRTRALARFKLAEEGGSVTAERRAKTHFGREHPFAGAYSESESGLRPGFGFIQSERDRSEQIKRVRLKSGERGGVAPGQHGL